MNVQARIDGPYTLSAAQYPNRTQYPQNRYLAHASTQELRQRFDDILGSNLRFTDGGKAVLAHPAVATNLLGHVMQEFSLRGERHIFLPSMQNLHFDDAKYPKARRGTALWAQMQPRPPYLLKFGKRKFLEPLVTEGGLRISAASHYRREDLPDAIRDDEVRSVRKIGPIRFERMESDYYLWSCSVRFDSRLFDDFEADCCLLVHDPNAFGTYLQRAVEEKLPEWSNGCGGVKYFDPFRPPLDSDLFFAKHFRYEYQTELRFVWIPPVPVVQVPEKYLDLNLPGNLSSFCELRLLS